MTAQDIVDAISVGINALHRVLQYTGQGSVVPGPAQVELSEIVDGVDGLVQALGELNSGESWPGYFLLCSDDLVRFERLQVLVGYWVESSVITVELVNSVEECIGWLRMKMNAG